MHALEDQELSADPADDDVTIETPEQRAAERKRLSRLKQLLTSTVLGTSSGEPFAVFLGSSVAAQPRETTMNRKHDKGQPPRAGGAQLGSKLLLSRSG